MTLDLASVLLQKLMYVLLPLFGVALWGNATLTIACICYHVLGGTLRCDVTPVLALTRFT